MEGFLSQPMPGNWAPCRCSRWGDTISIYTGPSACAFWLLCQMCMQVKQLEMPYRVLDMRECHMQVESDRLTQMLHCPMFFWPKVLISSFILRSREETIHKCSGPNDVVYTTFALHTRHHMKECDPFWQSRRICVSACAVMTHCS